MPSRGLVERPLATPPIGEVKFSFWAKVTKASAKTFLPWGFEFAQGEDFGFKRTF